MRRLYPLTPEEQEFAAIRIDLVDTFLRRERLDPNEYYDIVIFGYLEAVQKQHREPIEEERQNFNALAKICMRHAVGEDWKYRLKEKRKGDLLSLSLEHLATSTDNEDFSFYDIIPDSKTDIEMQVVNLDLIERLLAVATPREREAIDLVCQGYETREVADLLGIARLTSSVTLHHFRVKAKAVLAGQEAFVPRCQRPKQKPEEKAAKDKARRKAYQEAHPEEMRAKWREQGARKRARAREKKLAEARLQCETQEKYRPQCSEHQGRQVAVAV